MLLPRKSSGPNRSEMRPQWLVRPPSIRARHHEKSVPGGARVRLAVDLPAADAAVELAERAVLGGRPASGGES